MKKKYYVVFRISVFLILIFVFIMLLKPKTDNDINDNFQVEYIQKQIETIYSLLDEQNLDFDLMKNKYEIMCQNTPSIMLDLYEKGISQEKILGFNDTQDEVFHEINNKDVSNIFKYLSDLYDYLPSFVVNDELYKDILEVKVNIYKCRGALNQDDWNSLNEYNKVAVKEYMDVLNSIDKRLNQKQVNITYITINEMENAINLRDKSIYLIKYRFLLEQLNSI